MGSEPEVRPQRANPGGNLAPEDVVGRSQYVTGLWEMLERQSVLISAERRMGKTSILKKMRAEPLLGTVVIYRSFESVRSVREFLELVLEDVRDRLPTRLRAGHRFRDLVDSLGIAIAAGPIHLDPQVQRSWKDVIETVFVELDDADDRVVFLWDEVPVMVGAIAENEGPAAAQELLNALRTGRQHCDSIRMVFTGSIGLHHVLGGLRSGTYSNAPVNDMRLSELGGLDEVGTASLTRRLLTGENLRPVDEGAFISTMHIATAGIPFYVQQVIAQLTARQDRSVTSEDIDAVIEAAIGNALDPWHFEQYRSRLADYYGDQEGAALAILDAVAVADGRLTFDEVVNAVHSQAPADVEQVRNTLHLLELDHYLRWEDDRCRFSFGIIARAWKARRHL